jgi:hypothetical protein
MTTQAQKDAFCAIVNTCIDNSTEVVAGLGIPTLPPSNGEKVVVVQGVGGAPNQAYFWTGTQWILMGDGTGLSSITLGTGGNVTLSGNGTAASPLVGSVTFPAAPASTCQQVLASPAGVIQAVFGHDSAGACVREAVTTAPTLCQEIAALPAGAIATVVGRDASGNCVTGTVSGGSSAPAATDTVAGISALNLGNNLPADATNATDALTASGLAAILQQAGGNALTSAVCAATANCPVAAAPLAISEISACTNGGVYTGTIDSATVAIESASPLSNVVLQAFTSGGWTNVSSPVNTTVPANAPAGATSVAGITASAHTFPAGQYIYYRVVSGSVASPSVYLLTPSQIGQC